MFILELSGIQKNIFLFLGISTISGLHPLFVMNLTSLDLPGISNHTAGKNNIGAPKMKNYFHSFLFLFLSLLLLVKLLS